MMKNVLFSAAYLQFSIQFCFEPWSAIPVVAITLAGCLSSSWAEVVGTTLS